MTTSAFEQFLVQNKSRSVVLEGMPVAIFKADARVDEQHLSAAEKRLGVPLPASYKIYTSRWQTRPGGQRKT